MGRLSFAHDASAHTALRGSEHYKNTLYTATWRRGRCPMRAMSCSWRKVSMDLHQQSNSRKYSTWWRHLTSHTQIRSPSLNLHYIIKPTTGQPQHRHKHHPNIWTCPLFFCLCHHPLGWPYSEWAVVQRRGCNGCVSLSMVGRGTCRYLKRPEKHWPFSWSCHNKIGKHTMWQPSAGFAKGHSYRTRKVTTTNQVMEGKRPWPHYRGVSGCGTRQM